MTWPMTLKKKFKKVGEVVHEHITASWLEAEHECVHKRSSLSPPHEESSSLKDVDSAAEELLHSNF